MLERKILLRTVMGGPKGSGPVVRKMNFSLTRRQKLES